MFNKKYKFFKFVLFLSFIFLCVMFIYTVLTTINQIHGNTYSSIINDTHKIFIIGVFLVSFILFFKLIRDVENNVFVSHNKKHYHTISNVFLIGAIIEFIFTNLSVDATGIGIVGTDISLPFLFFGYNYIIFRVISYLIEYSKELYEDNKSII